MTTLGMANTRMRDFFDIYELARQCEFDGVILASAIRDTFARRRTPLGPDLPPALTSAFGADPDKQAQWRAFLRKSELIDAPQELLTAIEAIAGFLGSALLAVHALRFAGHWPAGGSWRL